MSLKVNYEKKASILHLSHATKCTLSPAVGYRVANDTQGVNMSHNAISIIV